MTEFEIESLKESFIQLGKMVQKYGKGYYKAQLKILSNMIVIIDSDCVLSEKEKYIIDYYKSLFSGKGDMSEFYIHDDDYKMRIILNEPLDKLKDGLWDIMKNYL
ncbi:MAG: hypothetical protein HFH77_10225 [Lachnospiraceae bacterium]|nr:hypothetical protein [Lachnospiraceae bacterium]